MSASRLALVVAGVLVALLIVEIALRNIGGVFHDTFAQLDLDRGWVLRPGFEGWVSEENTLWVRVNSDGMRDREHALAAAPRTLRIAILGDSYMEGLNVPLQKTFGSFLQTRMDRCVTPKGYAAETLNFGVSAYGTAQELLTFRLQAAKYRPQLVILAVYTGNDIFNNHRALNPNEYPHYSPYFTLSDGRLVEDEAFKEKVAATFHQPPIRRARMFLTDRLRTAKLLYEWYGRVRERVIPPPPAPPGDSDEWVNQIYLPPTDPQMTAAWNVTEALLATLNDEVTRAGAEFWIMTLANGPQIDPDLSKREALMRTLGVDSLDYPDRRIRDFATSHAIPVITLADRMGAYAAERKAHLTGGYNRAAPFGAGHLNEWGNELAAEIAGHELCSSSPNVGALR